MRPFPRHLSEDALRTGVSRAGSLRLPVALGWPHDAVCASPLQGSCVQSTGREPCDGARAVRLDAPFLSSIHRQGAGQSRSMVHHHRHDQVCEPPGLHPEWHGLAQSSPT